VDQDHEGLGGCRCCGKHQGKGMADHRRLLWHQAVTITPLNP